MNPPAGVVAAIAATTGAPPTSWRHVVAGHTHAEKWLVGLQNGRTAFVKAGIERSARAQIDYEAEILESAV